MKRLSNRQEEVMSIIWEHGPMTVNKIIPLIDNNLHYNTISTVVRELERIGYLSHKDEFRPYLYYPVKSKEEYLKELFDSILNRLFHGNKENLLKFTMNDFK